MKPVLDPRPMIAAVSPSDAVDRLPQPGHQLGLDHLRLEMLAQALHDVCGHAQQHVGVGDEELRLVVVADQGQPSLQGQPALGVRQLRPEVVPLDAIRVVQEVQGVVDGQPESRAPADQALMHIRRQADLAHLVEDLARDGQQPHQRRAGAAAEHHLQRSLEREDVAVEARRGRHVGEQILDVVERPRLSQGGGQVEDLLAEQEALFVVEHGESPRGTALAAWSPPPPAPRQPCRRRCACRRNGDGSCHARSRRRDP